MSLKTTQAEAETTDPYKERVNVPLVAFSARGLVNEAHISHESEQCWYCELKNYPTKRVLFCDCFDRLAFVLPH
jgi:hypothetical protein